MTCEGLTPHLPCPPALVENRRTSAVHPSATLASRSTSEKTQFKKRSKQQQNHKVMAPKNVFCLLACTDMCAYGHMHTDALLTYIHKALF